MNRKSGRRVFGWSRVGFVVGQRLLWAVFIVSTCFFGLLVLAFVALMAMVQGGDGGADSTTLWGALVAAVASFLTSVSSLAGLLLGWKKQKVDTAKADLEVQKLRLDLERANLEMEKLRPRKKKQMNLAELTLEACSPVKRARTLPRFSEGPGRYCSRF
ncbi:MAG: hypothetical protein ACT4O9_15315 [Blastocatellia bacterium]